MTPLAPSSQPLMAPPSPIKAPLLLAMEELAAAPTDGSPWSACLDPALFAQTLARLREMRSLRRPPNGLPPQGPLSLEMRDSACALAAATRSHALASIAKLGSPKLWAAIAEAMALSGANKYEAQNLLDELIPAIAAQSLEKLALSLFKAGAACSSHAQINALCQSGGAALLDRPTLGELFSSGLEQEILKELSERERVARFSIKYCSITTLSQLSASVFALASPSFTQSLIDLIIRCVDSPASRIGGLASIWARCVKTPELFSAQKSPLNATARSRSLLLTPEHAAGARVNASIWRSAVEAQCVAMSLREVGSTERSELLFFLSQFSVSSPELYLSLAPALGALAFEAREISAHHTGVGCFDLNSLALHAKMLNSKEPLPRRDDKINLFDIAFLSDAPRPSLAALASASLPSVDILQLFIRAHSRCPQNLKGETTLLWLESLRASPTARSSKTPSL